MTDPATFVHAFAAVRAALNLTQKRVGQLHGVTKRTVERWSLGATIPSPHDRKKLLHTLRDAPLPLLEALARASGTTLDAAGIAPARSVSPRSSSHASHSRKLEHAVRELADDLDVTAGALRPALARFLTALAGAGVPLSSASAMVHARPSRRRPRQDETTDSSRSPD